MANMTGDNITHDGLPYRVDVAAGTTGGAAGVNKLWLPLWSGEVINAYDQYNVFENMVTTRTLTNGFSYEFPITGTVDLTPSWNAGIELLGGQDAKSTTFKVSLDKRPMAAHFECDNVDLLVTQWDYRSELARQAGLTLANTRDKQLAMALVAASALPSLGSADPRGVPFHAPTVIATDVLASACTSLQALKVLEAVEAYLVANQESDLPVEGTCLAVTPKVFQEIRSLGIPSTSSSGAVDGNYTNQPMFTGGQAYGGYGPNIGMGLATMPESLVYMGVKIIKTNHFSKIDNSATANNIGSSKYNLNMAPTAYFNAEIGTTAVVTTGLVSNFSVYGIIFQANAIASLSLMGMKVDTVQDVRRNTQFTVASMLKGTGVIRPELCKALISGSAGGTRADVALHLNGVAINDNTIAAGVNANNFTSGFAADYATTQ